MVIMKYCELALFRLLVCWDDLVKSSRSLDFGIELNGGLKNEWRDRRTGHCR